MDDNIVRDCIKEMELTGHGHVANVIKELLTEVSSLSDELMEAFNYHILINSENVYRYLEDRPALRQSLEGILRSIHIEEKFECQK